MWIDSQTTMSILFAALARQQRALGGAPSSSGVPGREAQRPRHSKREESDAEGSDFQSIFKKALEGNGSQ